MTTRLHAPVIAMLMAALPASRSEAMNLFSYAASTGSGTACTFAAPCTTLQAAHDATSSGGVVYCLDDRAPLLNNLAITKSITIDCQGSSFEVAVNGVGIEVTLRNLTVSSFTPAIGGGNGIGIDFQNGAALFVENCVIQNFNTGAGGLGVGIKFAPAQGTTASLHVSDSVIKRNGLAQSGGGIIIQPAGSGSARVTIERTRVENNTYGIFANGTESTGVISMHVRDSLVANSVFNGISSFTSAGHSVASITVDHSSSVLNGSAGILAQGANAFVLLKGSTVMSNVTGLDPVSGGSIFTYQDNALNGNVTDGAPTGVLSLK